MALMWTSSGYMPRLKPRVGLPTYVVIAEILRRKTVAGACAGSTRSCTGQLHLPARRRGRRDRRGRGIAGYTVVDQSAEALSRANHYMCGDAVRRARQRLRRGQGVTTAYRAQRMARLVDEHVQQLGVRAAQEILTDRDGPGPWLHQFPWGPQRSTLSGMTIDSLLAVCEDGALYTCRGGGERGPWQRLRV